MKKIHGLYYSATGNTKRIVTGIAREMSRGFVNTDITPAEDRKEKQLSYGADDIVVVGAPVYGGRLPEHVAEYYKTLKAEGSKAVAIVTYGNRAYEDALLELSDILKEVGFEIVAAGAFVGEHTYTDKVANHRPDWDDMDRAYDFANQIYDRLEAFIKSEEGAPADRFSFPEISIPGNRPYKERGGARPKTAPFLDPKLCIKCGACMEKCPVKAIDREDYTKIDADKCLACGRCIKNCQVHAIWFTADWIKELSERLENTCQERKEPEVFL